MNEKYKKTILDNGIRVITDRLPGRLSISSGIWTNSGSRFDPPDKPGMAHLLEHMLFRGTRTHTSKEISEIVEDRGGSIDGFTDYDSTAIFVKLLAEDLAIGTDILTEMIREPLIDPDMLQREIDVVLEEIAADKDNHESRSFNNLAHVMWQNYPLSHEILGTPESVKSISSEDLWQYLRHRYSPEKMVIGAVGDVDHDEFLEIVRKDFDQSFLERAEKAPECEEPIFQGLGKLHLIADDTEQAQIYVVIPVGSFSSDDRYGYSIMTTLLGSGSSSRLFQSLRERESLAYATGAWIENFADQSFIICYADTNRNKAQKAIELILTELENLANNGIEADELARVKKSIAGKLALSTESSSGMLQRIMSNELILDRHISVEESISNFKKFSQHTIKEIAREKLSKNNMLLYAFGNIPKDIGIEGFTTTWHQMK